MERKVTPNAGVNVEKITNGSFDDVIGHTEVQRKYFTVDNNTRIYERLRSEVAISHMPYLGPFIDFGLGNICLEEAGDSFKFYIIDRASKYDYEEFDSIDAAIGKLVTFYQENEMVDNPYKMRDIFYQELGLEERDKNRGPVRGLR